MFTAPDKHMPYIIQLHMMSIQPENKAAEHLIRERDTHRQTEREAGREGGREGEGDRQTETERERETETEKLRRDR